MFKRLLSITLFSTTAKVVYEDINGSVHHELVKLTDLLRYIEIHTRALTKNVAEELHTALTDLSQSVTLDQAVAENQPKEKTDGEHLQFGFTGRLISILKPQNASHYTLVSSRDYWERVTLETTLDFSLEIFVPTMVNVVTFKNTKVSHWRPSIKDLTVRQPANFRFESYYILFCDVPSQEVTLNTPVYTPVLPNIYDAGHMCTGTTPKNGYTLVELIDFDRFQFATSRYNNDLVRGDITNEAWQGVNADNYHRMKKGSLFVRRTFDSIYEIINKGEE